LNQDHQFSGHLLFSLLRNIKYGADILLNPNTMIDGIGIDKGQLMKINSKIAEEILLLAHFLKLKALVKFLIDNILVPQLNRENALGFAQYALVFLIMPAPEPEYNEELEQELSEQMKDINELWTEFYS